MSWQTTIEGKELVITTGDKKEYTVTWQEPKKNIKFNTVGFNFIEKNGTYVDRGKKQGDQFPIVFYITGDDYITETKAFEESCLDSRPWTINHPIYGKITAQPISLTIDNTYFNASKITGTLWETLIYKYPKYTISQKKEIENLKSDTDEAIINNFSEVVGTPSSTIVEPSRSVVDAISLNYESITESSEDVTTLKNLLRSADNAVTEMISAPTTFIEEVISLINFPFIIEQDIESKVAIMLENIDELADLLLSEDDGYSYYEYQATTIFTELCKNLVNTSEDEYITRDNILSIIDQISGKYDDYRTNLDEFGTNPDYDVNFKLDSIINRTFAYLYKIAFNAKKEISIYLATDNNVVNLSHKYLGPGDDNLELFIKQNDITLKEYLNLKKGRKITYYV